MTAVKIAIVSGVLFVAFLIHSAAIGVASMSCDGSLAPWCWTRDLLGVGPAWLLLHALVSLGLGWCFVKLSEQ